MGSKLESVRSGLESTQENVESGLEKASDDADEMQAVRDALGLGASEQLCVSGENAPVTVVSEDGIRRQVN